MAKTKICNGQGKPFVKWVGGKSQLLNYIGEKLPDLNGKVYVEPFVGGGAVLWHVLNTYSPKRVVINDFNSVLITAYKVVRDETEGLIEMLETLQKTYVSKNTAEEKNEFYLSIRERFNKMELDGLEKTALFICLNKTAFNGLFRVNSKGLFNVPWGKYSNPMICDVVTIRNDAELLRKNNVEILNGDFAQTIQYIDKNTFVYLDSPYKPLTQTAAFTSYNKDGFNDDEQRRLKVFCDGINCRRGRFLLSNSDTMQCSPPDTFFDDLYSDYHIERVEAARMVNCNGKGRGKIKEILVSNF